MKLRYVFATSRGFNDSEGQSILQAAARQKVRCFEVTPQIVSYLSETVTPQGILAVARKPDPAWPQPPFSLVLAASQIQDAGNLGTLFRSAEAFGAQGVFLTDGCCDPFNPKVVRASMGSLFRVPYVIHPAWNQAVDWMKEKGFMNVALTGGAVKTLFELEFSRPVALWVGSEGSGLSEELSNACEERVKIPMRGNVESLNVGVAASLALFWAQYQRPVS